MMDLLSLCGAEHLSIYLFISAALMTGSTKCVRYGFFGTWAGMLGTRAGPGNKQRNGLMFLLFKDFLKK